MNRSKKFTEESKMVAVRLPKKLRARALQYCALEDLTISQLMRRAVKKELSTQPLRTDEVTA